MRLGADYSERCTNWARFAEELKARGCTFVGRYLAYDVSRLSSDHRALTRGELAAMRAAGIGVFLYWENSPDRVASHTERRAWDGYEAGEQDALLARAMARYLGFPDDTPIYYAVDVDCTAGRCLAYFNGVLAAEKDVRRVGVYGGWAVVSGLFDAGVVAWAVQTDAWRYGHGWDPRAQVHQWTVPEHDGYAGSVAGIECDGLDAVAEDIGAWEADEMTQEEVDKLLAGVAKDGYRAAIGTALTAGWLPEAQRLNDEFYRRWPRMNADGSIANSSGLPPAWKPGVECPKE